MAEEEDASLVFPFGHFAPFDSSAEHQLGTLAASETETDRF